MRTPTRRDLRRGLPQAEDVALGVAEVAPIPLGVETSTDLAVWCCTPGNQKVPDCVDIRHGEAWLEPWPVVCRLIAALYHLKDVRKPHIELHPAVTGIELGQAQHVSIECTLNLKVLHYQADPVRPGQC